MFQPDSVSGDVFANIYNAAPSGILNARYTMWMNGSGDILPESDSLYVRSLIDGNDSTAVNIKNFLADFEYCTGSSSAQQARGEEAVDGEALASTAVSGLGTEAVPDRWDVVARRTPGAALVRLAVPAGVEGPVRVAIYDVRGRRVAVPFERGTAAPGWYDLQWRQVDSSGRKVASGVYFLRVEADGVALSRKVVVVQ